MSDLQTCLIYGWQHQMPKLARPKILLRVLHPTSQLPEVIHLFDGAAGYCEHGLPKEVTCQHELCFGNINLETDCFSVGLKSSEQMLSTSNCIGEKCDVKHSRDLQCDVLPPGPLMPLPSETHKKLCDIIS